MNVGKTILGAAILVAGFALPARADLTVEIGSTTMFAGGTGTVDVTIKGESLLATTNMYFAITSPDWTGLVSFTPPAGPEPFTNLPNYVFYNNSSVWIGNSNFFGAPEGDPVGSVINGGDSTPSGDNVTVNPDTATLVATLYLTASTSAKAGQWTTITLAAYDPANHSFSYSVGIESPLVDYEYTSTAGKVTIAAAVPEPSSIALVLAGIFGSAATRFGVNRRRKTQAADDNTTMPTEAT